jgi:hypothetical protein
MFTCDRPRNAKAKADTRVARIARGVQAIERCKNFLLLLHRNAWAVIINEDHDAIGFANDLDARGAAVFDGIINQVRDGATNQSWSAGNLDAARAEIAGLAAGIHDVFAGVPDENTQIDKPSRPDHQTSCAAARRP